MKLLRFTKSFITIAVLLVLISGCMQKEIVKVDLDTYLKNQQQYQGEQFKDKKLVIAATLKDVNERYDAYKGKIIELVRSRYLLWEEFILDLVYHVTERRREASLL